jgi:hypothetical protein
MPLTLRDVTGHEMKVAHQRRRVPVYLDELAARGRLAGGLQSSMVIEEVESTGFILVDRLHDVVGFAGIILNPDFFSLSAIANFVPSLCPSLRPHVLILASMGLLTWPMQSPFSLFSLHKINS